MQFLIGRGKAIMREKVIATLLHHILQHNKACFLFFQALLQGRDGFFDGRSLFARRVFVSLGNDESFSENGEDQSKGLLAFCLSTQDSPNNLTFASPLPITVILWGAHVLADLLPGRANAICFEVIEVGPQERQGDIDH